VAPMFLPDLSLAMCQRKAVLEARSPDQHCEYRNAGDTGEPAGGGPAAQDPATIRVSVAIDHRDTAAARFIGNPRAEGPGCACSGADQQPGEQHADRSLGCAPRWSGRSSTQAGIRLDESHLITTGVPSGTSAAIICSASAGTRTHPSELAWPSTSSVGHPCTPTVPGPPPKVR
jgi:hypothetical protein